MIARARVLSRMIKYYAFGEAKTLAIFMQKYLRLCMAFEKEYPQGNADLEELLKITADTFLAACENIANQSAPALTLQKELEVLKSQLESYIKLLTHLFPKTMGSAFLDNYVLSAKHQQLIESYAFERFNDPTNGARLVALFQKVSEEIGTLISPCQVKGCRHLCFNQETPNFDTRECALFNFTNMQEGIDVFFEVHPYFGFKTRLLAYFELKSELTFLIAEFERRWLTGEQLLEFACCYKFDDPQNSVLQLAFLNNIAFRDFVIGFNQFIHNLHKQVGWGEAYINHPDFKVGPSGKIHDLLESNAELKAQYESLLKEKAAIENLMRAMYAQKDALEEELLLNKTDKTEAAQNDISFEEEEAIGAVLDAKCKAADGPISLAEFPVAASIGMQTVARKKREEAICQTNPEYAAVCQEFEEANEALCDVKREPPEEKGMSAQWLEEEIKRLSIEHPGIYQRWLTACKAKELMNAQLFPNE